MKAENRTEFEFKSCKDGTCVLSRIRLNEKIDELFLPSQNPEGERVTTLGDRKDDFRIDGNTGEIRVVHVPASYEHIVGFLLDDLSHMISWEVAPENKTYVSVDGLLYSRDLKTIVSCPFGRSGVVEVPEGTVNVGPYAFFGCFHVQEVILPESIRKIDEDAFSDTSIVVRIPGGDIRIDDSAFGGEYEAASVKAPRNSRAHRFAVEHDLRFIPCEKLPFWDSEAWKKKFKAARDKEAYRALRREVWLDTLTAVKNAGYNLPNGDTVALDLSDMTKYGSRFYSHEFHAACFPVEESVEIRVVSDDCLDVARAWAEQGLEVTVLNMASRRNPGGGVTNGAGAQEEYLFRCSDYYRSLYRYVSYAFQYDLDRARHSYPLDRNFGGIYSPSVTVFRGNEAGGYKLLENPFHINLIAVAGMNRPELVYEDGEARIAPHLVEGIKNKIRTILRIAQDNGQRNLVLGALGCGAFRNPPKHVAELFRLVLCEDEFFHAFQRITFAVKSDHNSNGSANFNAFFRALNGFVPDTDQSMIRKRTANIGKIAVSRGVAALLRKDGSVRLIDIYKNTEIFPFGLYHLTDIAAGFEAVFGLGRHGQVKVFGARGNDAYAKYISRLNRNVLPVDGIFACENHMALLFADGSVRSWEGGTDIFYAKELNQWKEIKDLALTFDYALGLRRDGTVTATHFPWGTEHEHPLTGHRAVRIESSCGYYMVSTSMALHDDGTVLAYTDTCQLKGASMWKNIVKIGCCSGAAFGLDKDGVLYRSCGDESLEMLRDVADFACNTVFAVALDNYGRLHVIDRYE